MLNQRGFNMIELIIATAIIATAAVIAVPSFQIMIANTQTRTLAESFVNGLQVARLEAVKRNKQVKFQYNELDLSWEVGCVNVTATCPAIITSKPANEGGTPAMVVTKVGQNQAVFSNLGMLSSTANQLSRVNIINSSIPATKATKLSVLLGVGGNARMCDQDVTDLDDPRSC